MAALKARIGGAWVDIGLVGVASPASGLEAAKPTTPTSPGFEYFATDTKRFWMWDGTGWIIMREPWQTYAMALTAVTTNPNVGAGLINASYRRRDGVLDIMWYISFGAGMTAGSGAYRLGTPFPIRSYSRAAALGVIAGGGLLYGAGTGTWAISRLLVNPNNVSYFTLDAAQGAGGLANVTHAVPWAWVSGMEIEGWASAPLNNIYS